MSRALTMACLVLACASSTHAEEKRPILGQKVDSFTLKDYRGREYTLEGFKDSRVLVVVFLGTECPLVKLYGPRLEGMARAHAEKGVAFVGINANAHDSITEIATYAREHGITFPILKDLGNRLADRLGAERTPEVYVLDQERVVRYHGRVDDQYGVGYARDRVRREDLRLAIEDLLAGRKVAVAETEAPGCFIGRVRTPKADSKVTYTRDVAPLLARRCVECHREGEIAPFSLTSYREAAGWADTIQEVVDQGRMPPWHASPAHGKFANERRLSDEEKKLIRAWVAAGAPEGDPADLPPPPSFTTGWQLPREPDRIIPMREQPWDVPAEGAVRYQYFRVDPGFKEDVWVQAAELQPGSRAVVHHILVLVQSPEGQIGGAGGREGFLVAYVPGLRARPYPEGMAKRIPAGSKLIFQLHYTPIGTPQKDLSRLGLVFADPKKVTHEVRTAAAVNRWLLIPPKAGNHLVEATSPAAGKDVQLLGLMPHMHLRGKSFRYEAIYPGGKKEVLLDVPAYDFNWQTAYRLAEPKALPAGTRVHCVAHFDNSEGNPHNPDPERVVRWGDQTWEEMMIGYFDIATPRDPAPAAPGEGGAKVAIPAGGYPIPVQYQAAMRRFDRNEDLRLSREEIDAMPDRARERVLEFIRTNP